MIFSILFILFTLYLVEYIKGLASRIGRFWQLWSTPLEVHHCFMWFRWTALIVSIDASLTLGVSLCTVFFLLYLNYLSLRVNVNCICLYVLIIYFPKTIVMLFIFYIFMSGVIFVHAFWIHFLYICVCCRFRAWVIAKKIVLGSEHEYTNEV